MLDETSKLDGGVERYDLRMWSDANIVCAKASIEPQHPLLLRDLPEAIAHALVRQRPIRRPLLLLQPRLDEIKRQAEETSKEPRHRTRRQRLRPRAQARPLQPLLRLGEERQLAEIQRHRAHDRRRRARPEPAHALGLGNAGERVDDGLVVLALRQRLQAVGLHADERQVRRVADHGRQPARRQARGRALLEADAVALRLRAPRQLLHERVEEPQPRRRVDGLPQQARGQPRVQIQHLAGGDDLARHAQRRRLGPGARALAGQLQPHLDHVDGLDHRRGDHAGGAAVDEGQRAPHERRVEEVGLRGEGVGFGGVGEPFGGFHCFGGFVAGSFGCLLDGV